MLVGNKIDNSHREVTEDELKSFSSRKQLNYCLCSAKEGTNVNECFSKLVNQILGNETLMNSISTFETDISNTNINNKEQKESSGCC